MWYVIINHLFNRQNVMHYYLDSTNFLIKWKTKINILSKHSDNPVEFLSHSYAFLSWFDTTKIVVCNSMHAIWSSHLY